jgi:hypothetical protein
MNESEEFTRVPENKTHLIWFEVVDNPGINEADIIEKFKGTLTPGTIGASLRILYENNHLRREPSDRVNLRKRTLYYYWPNLEEPYQPSSTARRTNYADDYARLRQELSEHGEKPDLRADGEQSLDQRSGMNPSSMQSTRGAGWGVGDHSNPNHDVLIPSSANRRRRKVKPLAMVAFDLSTGRILVPLAEAREIYEELHAIFGKPKA